MAASTAMRLQTIVSREIAPIENAVLTIGALQAGTKENIIPDDATLKLNIRTFDDGVRDHILSAVKRICCAECAASNAPRDPEFTSLDSYPLTENDAIATAKVAEAFHAQFGERAYETQPASASEDFSIFGRNWKGPYVFWFVGGTDANTYLQAKKNNQLNSIPSHPSNFKNRLTSHDDRCYRLVGLRVFKMDKLYIKNGDVLNIRVIDITLG